MAPLTSCVTKENAVNYGKVVYSLGENWQKRNAGLLFHEDIVKIGENRLGNGRYNHHKPVANAYVLACN